MVKRDGTAIQNTLIRTNQLDKSDYLNFQLLGEYNLTEDKNQTIKAGVSYADTKFEQPDRKFFTGQKTSEDVINTSYGANNFLTSIFNCRWKFLCYQQWLNTTLNLEKTENKTN